MSSEESKPESGLKALLNDLFYPSESDELIEFVEYTMDFEPPLTVSQIHDLLLVRPEVYVEEISENDFWEPVVTEQDWYEEEKQRTARFVELRKQIEQLLKNRQVFRVGETEVDLYLLGRKADGHWAGLKTLVVET